MGLLMLLALNLAQAGVREWPGVTSGVQVIRATSQDATLTVTPKSCGHAWFDPLDLKLGEGWRAMPSGRLRMQWDAQPGESVTLALTQQRGHKSGCWVPSFLIAQKWLPDNIAGPDDPDPPFDPGDKLPVPCPSLPAGDPPDGTVSVYSMFDGPIVSTRTPSILTGCSPGDLLVFGEDPAFPPYAAWDREFTWDATLGYWVGKGFGFLDDRRDWAGVTIYGDPSIRQDNVGGACHWSLIVEVYNTTSTPTRFGFIYEKFIGSTPAGIYTISPSSGGGCVGTTIPQTLTIM